MARSDPLLRELLLETPWNMGVLEHALARARQAGMPDDEIRRLLRLGGPDLIHAYVAVLESHMLYDCWCGERHWKDPLEPGEAVHNLGHLILGSLRIPQLSAWLDRKLRRFTDG